MRVVWEPVHGATQSVRLLRLRQTAFAGALHAHEALELTWIERGEGLRIVGGRVEPFVSDDVVLIAAGVPHVWLSRNDCPAGVAATVLQLPPSPTLAALPEWRGLAPLLEHARRGLAVEGAPRLDAIAALARMPSAPGPALLGAALSVLAALADAGDALRPLDALPAAPGRTRPGRERRLDALLAWVRNRLHGPLDIKAAAAILHVSPGAFSRSFQRLAGKPFTAYVNDLRIAEACLQLKRTDRPIAEVAQRCGFATLSHFNRQFRLRAGVAPRAYRRSG
ncbi:MAG: AraC family transcriptional regulator [Lysobacteraceae bacterium]|nr:MAG: AraC family transcriptional regulator [Xanthomonadaceae bacterium]